MIMSKLIERNDITLKFRLPKELGERLEAYAKAKHMPVSKVIRLAINNILGYYHENKNTDINDIL